MEVILLENILNLGNIGDKVKVKNGYGRNYLLKQGKALRFNKSNEDFVNKKKDELNKKKILNGNKVLIDENSRSFVKIYDKSSRFLGVGKINKNSELIPKKILI